MQTGDAILLRTVKSVHYDKAGKFAAEYTFKAEKDRPFLVLLLGTIDVKDPKTFDTEPLLNALGWHFCADCQAKHAQEAKQAVAS